MKKTLIAVLGMAMIAPMAWAQTNVLSQNAVGYVKVSIDRGDLALVRYDFQKLDASPATLTDIVGDQLPASSIAYYWDRLGKSWQIQVKGARGWPTTGAATISRGDAFFLLPPAGAANPSYDVYLLGEVPGANNGSATTPVNNVQGDAIGFPYPAATTIAATDIGIQAGAGTTLYTWNQVSQGWNSAVSKGARGWPAVTITPGQGFFINSAGGAVINATETKPYVWP